MRKKIIICILLYFILGGNSQHGKEAKNNLPSLVIAKMPAPVLNTPDFTSVFGGRDGKSLSVDDFGLIREIEFIALPGAVFEVEDIRDNNGNVVYRVTTNDYPYPALEGYFIDSRFVNIVDGCPSKRLPKMPKKEAILENLLSSEGSAYVWGGNYKEGIPELLYFYPPSFLLGPDLEKKWILKGLDCSGLLYQATNGSTPRNTSSLVNFGNVVKIFGLGVEEIIQRLEPLDIIVWNGRVIIVLDREQIIDSRLDQGGVRVRGLKEALEDILKERIPVDDYNDNFGKSKKRFVIRRWCN